MANITTGISTVGKFTNNQRRNKTEELEDDGTRSNFHMDPYNSGLIFGTKSELEAFRFNLMHERKLKFLLKYVDKEKRESIRRIERNKCIYDQKYQKLKELNENTLTYLDPDHYAQLNRLHQLGKLSSVSPSGRVRPNSAALISQKARQLGLTVTPKFNRPQSASASIPTNTPNSSFRLTIPVATSMSAFDNDKIIIKQNPDNPKDCIMLRVTVLDGCSKSTQLKMVNKIPNCVTINRSQLLEAINRSSNTVYMPQSAADRQNNIIQKQTESDKDSINNYIQNINRNGPTLLGPHAGIKQRAVSAHFNLSADRCRSRPSTFGKRIQSANFGTKFYM